MYTQHMTVEEQEAFDSELLAPMEPVAPEGIPDEELAGELVIVS